MINISGKVIRGKGKGKILGFPTVNLELKDEIKNGVYKGKLEIGSKKFDAAIFIKNGVLEAHIIGYSGDLYGKVIEIEIGEKIRDVMKFESNEDLIRQIKKDIDFISRSTRINTQNDAEKFLYSDITYKIRGACFEVYKQFGGAFKEKVIENALLEELKNRELEIETQKRIDIYFKDKKVGTYVPDIIVNKSVLVELKCKPFITKEDERQFWLYLKGSEYKLGLLINFGSNKLEIRRRIYDSARKNLRKSA